MAERGEGRAACCQALPRADTISFPAHGNAKGHRGTSHLSPPERA